MKQEASQSVSLNIPDASSDPSRENTQQATYLVCPSNTRRHVPLGI